MAKITFATVKSFIKKNNGSLYIKVERKFDGMVDGVRSVKDDFSLVEADKTESKCSDYNERTQGIKGAWFVGSSRDYFNEFEDCDFKGISVSNSCGSFVLAVKK